MSLTLTAGSVWGAANLHAADQQLMDGPPAAPIQMATSHSPSQPTAQSAMVPRDQYAAALRAQMQRVQREQGAPAGFAEQALAKQLAYLEDTADNRYAPQRTRLGQVTQHVPTRPTAVQPTLAPPVHVAPTAYSSPPPVASTSVRPRVAPSQPTAHSVVANDQPTAASQQPEYTREQNHNLQDRIESLLTARRLAAAGRQSIRAEPQPLYRPETRQIPSQELEPRAAVAQALARMDDQYPKVADVMPAEVTPVSLNQPLPARSAIDPQQPMRAPVRSFAPPAEPPQLTAPQANSSFSQAGTTPARSVSVLSRGPLQDQESGGDFALPPSGLQQPDSAPPVQDLPVGDNDLRPSEDSGQDRVEDRLNEIDRRLQQERQDADRGPGAGMDLPSQDQDALLTCDEYRSRLLGQSIRDIALDISPPASEIRDQYVAISRGWTDRLGNVVATGTMVDLRRGYVIIDGTDGRIKIPYGKLSDADWAAIADYWQIPELCGVGGSAPPMRIWVPQTYTWKASALCHKPLYFENVQLERYGHSHGPILQPIHSTAHFFVRLFTLPYQTAIHPPNECMYALGYYRPGNCAPWLKDPIPFTIAGLRRQALITTGFAFIP